MVFTWSSASSSSSVVILGISETYCVCFDKLLLYISFIIYDVCMYVCSCVCISFLLIGLDWIGFYIDDRRLNEHSLSSIKTTTLWNFIPLQD